MTGSATIHGLEVGFARQLVERLVNIGHPAQLVETSEEGSQLTSQPVETRAKDHFLASMSHELRTPLNGIIGFGEMIALQQLGPIGVPKYADYANDIVRSAKRLMHVLNDILDMAKLESGRAEVIHEVVHLDEIVAESLAEVKERVQKKLPMPKTRISDDFPEMWTDRRLLRQVLINLVANALNFTDADGEISINASLQADGVLIAVIDSGRGMNPQELRQAISRFAQVDERLARRHEGVGLGLPLSRSVVELLGGKLTIQSKPGFGTCVEMRFPFSKICQANYQWHPPKDRMAERARHFEANDPYLAPGEKLR